MQMCLEQFGGFVKSFIPKFHYYMCMEICMITFNRVHNTDINNKSGM